MRQSLLFNKTRKNVSKDIKPISNKYLVKGDFIERTISGVYRYLPLGFNVLKKIEEIIREEMIRIGGQELLLPTFQNKKLWKETGRWEEYGSELFKLEDVHGGETALGPTHEEEVTDIVRTRISSYRDLPFSVFQIQNKFRNELRSTGGVLRTREFMMKDLYSFHADKQDLIRFYKIVKKAYFKVFKRCGLEDVIAVEAESGAIGGAYSQEFMLISDIGEDTILVCEKCGFGANIEKTGKTKKCPECGEDLKKKESIELGHAFNLGTKYSKPMEATFINEKEEEEPIIMGCYGLGVSRLIAAIIEAHHDSKGIIWPLEVAPYRVHLISLSSKEKVNQESDKIYKQLQDDGISVLYDDREDKSAGEKFMDSDLIGIPIRLVVSKKTLKENSIGFKKREEEKEKLVKISKLRKILKSVK